MDSQNNIAWADLSDLYTIRMLVFIEDTPQSNKYRQVRFTKDQHKLFSDAIAKIFPNPNDPTNTFRIQLATSTKTFSLPDIPEIYDSTCSTTKHS